MKLNIYSIFLVTLILNGCSTSNDLVIPQIEFPSEYQHNNTIDKKDSIVEEMWWENFQDKKLSSLIEETLKNNYDLQIAMVNISLNRASLSLKVSERYPTLASTKAKFATGFTLVTLPVLACLTSFHCYLLVVPC